MNIKSRLLKRLDAEIAASTALSSQVACLKVQRALLLARHGLTEQAQTELAALHQLAWLHPHPTLGAWLHFADGLMSYFADFSGSAHEKIERAQAIAKSIEARQLAALSSAWLAQLAYVRHDLPAMLLHARDCDALAEASDHGSRFRLCTVLAVAHHFAANDGLGKAWFTQARAHALADGDDASLSALIYNMAEVRTTAARHQSFSSRHAGEAGMLLGVDSIKHYDAAVGGSVRSDLTSILRAQSLTVEGDYAQAKALFATYLPVAISAGLAQWSCRLWADLAWCSVNSGEAEQALKQAQAAETELMSPCDVDDRACTHSRLAQIYAALGDTKTATAHAETAALEWQKFADQQAAWGQALAAADLQPR